MTKKVKEKKPSLDIFEVLGALDKRDMDWLDGQTPEMAKTFSPLVVMRWFSAVADRSGVADYHIMMTNEIVNIGFWELSKFPDLQWKLLATCGSGSTLRHQWIPGTKKKNTNKLDNFILSMHPSFNETELALYKSKLTKESLSTLLKEMGYADDQIKPIVEDFKKL